MFRNLGTLLQSVLDSPNGDTRRPLIDGNFESNIPGLFVIGDLAFAMDHDTPLPMLIPVVLALVSRARWAQWVAGLSYLAMALWYTIAFCSTLS